MTFSQSDLNDLEKRFPRENGVATRTDSRNRILVLCIDRDDDIGSKGGVKTPIMGRDHCVEAGLRLAIEDPEDPDANAIFGAVKAYEKLVSKGYDSEVALVAGKRDRGIEADEKIGIELNHVLNRFHADAAAIISDGEDDEAVVPVIQTMIPVI